MKKACVEVEIIITLFFVFTTLSVTIGLCWYSSAKKAKLINNQFGTNYSASDMFWVGDTIEKIIIGQKNRIDLNKQEVKP